MLSTSVEGACEPPFSASQAHSAYPEGLVHSDPQTLKRNRNQSPRCSPDITPHPNGEHWTKRDTETRRQQLIAQSFKERSHCEVFPLTLS